MYQVAFKIWTVDMYYDLVFSLINPKKGFVGYCGVKNVNKGKSAR